MFLIIFLIVLFIVVVILFVRYEFKKLENTVYKSFKKLGIKALGIFAIFNIFNSSNNELSDTKSDEQETN